MTMPIGGGMMAPQQQFQSPAALNKTATNDTQFNQTVSQALDAAFGADPASGQVMPGPISHLMDRMKGDFNRSGMSGLGGLFPEAAGGNQAGTQAPLPPLLTGQLGDMFPGGGALVQGQGPGQANPFSNLSSGMNPTQFQGGNSMPAANRNAAPAHQFAPIMERGAVGMIFQLANMMMLMLQSMKGASA